jgi:drug/metabolite transporter (DMT)-like permease
VDEIGAVALSLGAASLILLPFAAWSMPRVVPSALSLASIGVLGLFSSAGALLLYFHVIHAAGAARASIVAYISPAIAAILGVVVLHEHFGIGIAAGLGLILLGSALGSSGARQRAAIGAAAGTDPV